MRRMLAWGMVCALGVGAAGCGNENGTAKKAPPPSPQAVVPDPREEWAAKLTLNDGEVYVKEAVVARIVGDVAPSLSKYLGEDLLWLVIAVKNPSETQLADFPDFAQKELKDNFGNTYPFVARGSLMPPGRIKPGQESRRIFYFEAPIKKAEWLRLRLFDSGGLHISTKNVKSQP